MLGSPDPLDLDDVAGVTRSIVHSDHQGGATLSSRIVTAVAVDPVRNLQQSLESPDIHHLRQTGENVRYPIRLSERSELIS